MTLRTLCQVPGGASAIMTLLSNEWSCDTRRIGDATNIGAILPRLPRGLR